MEHSVESLVREAEGTDIGVHEEDLEESEDVVIYPPEQDEHVAARTADQCRDDNKMPDFKAEVLNDEDRLLVRTVDVDKMTDSVCNQYYQDLKREQSSSSEKKSPATKNQTYSSLGEESPTGAMSSFGNKLLGVVLSRKKPFEKLEISLPKR
jgi:hypothetical protein